MSESLEYMTVISPLLSNKIDEISDMISSNLDDLKLTINSLDTKVSIINNKLINLQKKVNIIENTQKNLDLISTDYWTVSD